MKKNTPILILAIIIAFSQTLLIVGAKNTYVAPYTNEPVTEGNSIDLTEWSDSAWYNYTWTLIESSDPQDPHSPKTEYTYSIKTAYKHNNTHLMIYFNILDDTYNPETWADYPRKVRFDDRISDYLTIGFDVNEDEDPNSNDDDLKAILLSNYPLDGAWTPWQKSDVDLDGYNDIYGYSEWKEVSGYSIVLIFPLSSGDLRGQDINAEPGDTLYGVFFYNDASVEWNAYYPRGFDLVLLTEEDSNPRAGRFNNSLGFIGGPTL